MKVKMLSRSGNHNFARVSSDRPIYEVKSTSISWIDFVLILDNLLTKRGDYYSFYYYLYATRFFREGFKIP